MIPLLIGVAVAACLSGVGLAIVALDRGGRLRALESRVAGIEAALVRLMEGAAAEGATGDKKRSSVLHATPSVPLPEPSPTGRQSLEALIGEKWLGWLAILLIFCAASFFLKYAF